MPEQIYFGTGDCVLMVGPSELLLKRLEMLRAAGLRGALLCTDFQDMAQLPRGLRALSGELASLSGWMGQFTASLRTPQGTVDLAPLSFHDDGHFDWVLDFSGAVRTEVPPLGYYPLPVDDFPALKHALLEIAGRVRTGYDKPRYFTFVETTCAHRRQGIAGCNACLSVCPAGAITGEKESIRIEPHLCQGCGTCTLVCPTGAVRYADPDTAFSLKRLHAMLAGWRANDGGTVGLWIVPADPEVPVPEGWIPYTQRETGSLGLEFWLAALVAGCNRIAIDDSKLTASARAALHQQIDLAVLLLRGLGYPSSIGLATDTVALAGMPSMPALPIQFLQGADKRVVLFDALDMLIDSAPSAPQSVPLDDAPMGAVHVDAGKCTLCATCVRICPANALTLPGTTTQLAFTEQNCTQCGLCVHACPENAIQLGSRLLISASARRAPRVVAEAEAFTCASCGKPFSTKAMMARSRAMMADHPMFQGKNAALMEMCPDCRQRSQVEGGGCLG